MTQHPHRHSATDGTAHHTHHSHDDDAGLAELLELDASVLGPLLGEVVEWTAQHVRGTPRTVVDVGAGTGTGSLALARRFPAAEVTAIDRSAPMLARVRAAAGGAGLAGRLRTVQADLDAAWPGLGPVDLAWVSSALHEVADPHGLLRALHTALAPDGLLVVVEMDALPRFLPEDVGVGRPGLEARCHEALARAGWNAHPDWRPALEQAGFRVAAQRRFHLQESPPPPGTGDYAHAWLRRVRAALDEQLAAEDLRTLDRLLAQDAPGALRHRRDLTLRAERTAWAARRP